MLLSIHHTHTICVKHHNINREELSVEPNFKKMPTSGGDITCSHGLLRTCSCYNRGTENGNRSRKADMGERKGRAFKETWELGRA